MTRINAGIHPEFLTDEHLLAEHREITRLATMYYKRRMAKGDDWNKDLPTKPTLGKGHVLYHLRTIGYISNRYQALYRECLQRGFNVTDYSPSFLVLFKIWPEIPINVLPLDIKNLPYNNDVVLYHDYVESIKERIKQRILESKKETWRYWGDPISKELAINILNR